MLRNGRRSDYANLTRAKDAGLSLALATLNKSEAQERHSEGRLGVHSGGPLSMTGNALNSIAGDTPAQETAGTATTVSATTVATGRAP